MRGDCPVGGLKVTGYITPAARYCAITGGEYAITGGSGAKDKQGSCTFKDGWQCNAWDYYNGKCALAPRQRHRGIDHSAVINGGLKRAGTGYVPHTG